jgi:hypothetical protein
MFTAGLDEIRTDLAGDKNAGSFYFVSTDHTSLGDDNYYSRAVTGPDGGTIVLAAWVGDLVAGHVSNAGP